MRASAAKRALGPDFKSSWSASCGVVGLFRADSLCLISRVSGAVRMHFVCMYDKFGSTILASFNRRSLGKATVLAYRFAPTDVTRTWLLF